MKKFFLFASAALVLASCSSEAEEAVIKPNETPEEEVLELTEIKLGGGAPTVSAETRAAVELSTWNDTEVGIFGVNESSAATDNDWSIAPLRNQKNIAVEQAVILLNEPAKVGAGVNGLVTFDDGKIYFPRGNSKSYGYTFLGYYPYVEETGVTASTDKITVTGKFDGTQDIMAGKAASVDPLNNGNGIGYNAKYIRDYREQYSSDPTINIPFSHLTTKISILLKKTTNYDAEMCNVHAAYFDVEPEYTLTFAQDASEKVKTTLEFSGESVPAYAIGGATFDPAKSYKAEDVVKYGENYYKFNQPHRPGPWTNSDASVVDPVEPELNPSSEYTIFVTPDPQQNSGRATKTLHLVLNDDINDVKDITVTSPTDGFEAGKAYTVTVTINGPEEIKVTASITEWGNGGAANDVEI